MKASSSAGPKVLVLGSLPRVVLAVIRSLGRAGVQVHLGWDLPDSPLLRSRYLFKTHLLPPYDGPRSPWLHALRNLMGRENFDLVMPCTDWDTLLCHTYRNEIKSWGRLYVPNAEAFEILASKEKATRWAREVNVRTPRELIVTSPGQVGQVLAAFHFPVVLKPRQTFQLDNPGAWQKVEKAYTEAEFYAHMDRLAQSGDMVVQENFIGKGVGVTVLMNHGRLLLAFQHERVHEPMYGGPSSYRKSVPLSRELLEASLRILEPLKYTGVAMVELKVNEHNNDWVFLEVNPRFWGSLPLAIAAGANFPLALFELWVYNRTRFHQAYRPGIYCRDLSMDISWWKANLLADHADPTLETRPVLKTVSEACWHMLTLRERFDFWAADDPRPGMMELGSVLRRIGRSAFAVAKSKGSAAS